MSHVQIQQIIPASRMDVFRYLSNPEFLPQQFSGLIGVKWQNPGIEFKLGSEFLFVMERYGIEQPIRFRVDKLVAGNSFSYQQLEGFFSSWSHTIKFEDHGADQTLVTDLVDYEVPFGLFGRLVDDFWWREDLKRILKTRLDKASQALQENSVKNGNGKAEEISV